MTDMNLSETTRMYISKLKAVQEDLADAQKAVKAKSARRDQLLVHLFDADPAPSLRGIARATGIPPTTIFQRKQAIERRREKEAENE